MLNFINGPTLIPESNSQLAWKRRTTSANSETFLKPWISLLKASLQKLGPRIESGSRDEALGINLSRRRGSPLLFSFSPSMDLLLKNRDYRDDGDVDKEPWMPTTRPMVVGNRDEVGTLAVSTAAKRVDELCVEKDLYSWIWERKEKSTMNYQWEKSEAFVLPQIRITPKYPIISAG